MAVCDLWFVPGGIYAVFAGVHFASSFMSDTRVHRSFIWAVKDLYLMMSPPNRLLMGITL